ncbi:MAG: tetratricopeptide repeat protein, partial [Thermodesulfobacteriota bacterium]
KVIYLRIGLVFSAALILSFGEMARGESGDDLFSQGMKAYENGDFQISIDKLSKAVPLLKGDRQRIDAFKTMAFAYMAFLKKEEARQQFCNILKMDPTFELDPIMTPPKILVVLQEAKEKCLPFGGIEVQAIAGDRKIISGAKVYLNGKLIGETPLQKKDILPGEYELKVHKDGFRPFEAKISIEEKVVREVKSSLIEEKRPTITSIGHDVTTPLVAGDTIEVILIGDSGKTAVFDLGDVKKNLPMQEISPGKYVGIYRVGEKDQFSDLTIIGHLEGQHGARASMMAGRAISVSALSRSEILFQRGKASMERGEYDLGIDSLSKALYEDPNFVDAHILLAKAYNEKKGAYLESVKYLKNAIELEADNLEALGLLAKIYIENGKYEDALPVVKKILGISPSSGFAHGYMGEILFHKGTYGGSIEALRKSLQLDQGNPRIYFLLGKVFERMDRLADAVFEYETAVELSPTTFEYRNALANVYRALDQEMSAFRQWEKCLELDELTELERKEVRRKLSELRR